MRHTARTVTSALLAASILVAGWNTSSATAVSSGTAVFIHGVSGGAESTGSNYATQLYGTDSAPGDYQQAYRLLASRFTRFMGLTYYGKESCTKLTVPSCSSFPVNYALGVAAPGALTVPQVCRPALPQNMLGTGGSLLQGWGPLVYAYHLAWYLKTKVTGPVVLIGHSQGALIAETIRLLAVPKSRWSSSELATLDSGGASRLGLTAWKLGIAAGCWPDLTAGNGGNGAIIEGLVSLDGPHKGFTVDWAAVRPIVLGLIKRFCNNSQPCIDSLTSWSTCYQLGEIAARINGTHAYSDLLLIMPLAAGNACPENTFSSVYRYLTTTLATSAPTKVVLPDTIAVGAETRSIAVKVMNTTIGSILSSSSLGIPGKYLTSAPIGDRSFAFGLRVETNHSSYWGGVCGTDARDGVCPAVLFTSGSTKSAVTWDLSGSGSDQAFWDKVGYYASLM